MYHVPSKASRYSAQFMLYPYQIPILLANKWLFVTTIITNSILTLPCSWLVITTNLTNALAGIDYERHNSATDHALFAPLMTLIASSMFWTLKRVIVWHESGYDVTIWLSSILKHRCNETTDCAARCTSFSSTYEYTAQMKGISNGKDSPANRSRCHKDHIKDSKLVKQ